MDEITILLQAVEEAGAAILELQNHDLDITHKSPTEILTKADLLSDSILKKYLLGHFPQDGWLSEETIDDHRRLNCKRVWIVDPIDGTLEYSKGIPEYAISVALVENGMPTLSAVFNPAKNELFHAIKNQGAWLNNKKITCASLSDDTTILASRTEYDRGKWASYEKSFKIQPIGSIAYKLALIAAGRGHATLSLGPKNEWDIAGGVLLVQEAGGVATNKIRESIVFNQTDVKVNGIVATNPAITEQIFSLIENR